MYLDSQPLKLAILYYLTKARDVDRLPGIHKLVRAKYDGIIQALEVVSAEIVKSEKTGELNMDSFKIGLEGVLDLETIQTKRKPSIDDALIQLAPLVKSGKAKPINSDLVRWSTFHNRVYTLRKEGKLPKTFRPLKDEEGRFYLANDPNARERRERKA